MQLGQVVDFVIAYNDRNKQDDKKSEQNERRGNRRKATQAEINAFFG